MLGHLRGMPLSTTRMPCGSCGATLPRGNRLRTITGAPRRRVSTTVVTRPPSLNATLRSFAARISIALGVAGAATVVGARDLTAQPRPAGAAPRVWLGAALGAGREAQRCTACSVPGTIGGAVLTLSGGVTLPRGFGGAVSWHQMAQAVSSNASQRSRYIVGRVQYSPADAPELTVSAGLGGGRHWGSDSPYGNVGSTTVAALGGAVRVPRAHALGLTLSVDYLHTLRGQRDAGRGTASFPAGAYRPRLLTVGLGFNVAAAVAR